MDPVLLISALIGAIIVGVVARTMLIASMSNVAPANSASEYLEKSSVRITENTDTFLFTKVNRRPKPKK